MLEGERFLASTSVERAGSSRPQVGQVAAAFELYLRRQGRSPGTLAKYLPIVRHLVAWAGPLDVCALTAGEVDLYLAGWEAAFEAERGRPLSRASVRVRIAALRSFFDYLERFELLRGRDGRPARNPMRAIVAPRVQQQKNDFLHPAEEAALLAAASTAGERLLLWLLRYSGLRVSEACSLRVADVDLSPGAEAIRIRASKTPSGERLIPVLPELLPLLQAWIASLEQRGLANPQAPLLADRKSVV